MNDAIVDTQIEYQPTLAEELSRIQAANEAKRKAAIEHLGENWILHPRYQFQQRHALKGWEPHSTLQQVMVEARVGGRI